jgi:hypothetical protein
LHEIAESFGTDRITELLDTYQEHYLIEFYIQLLRNTELLTRAVRNGRMDHIIRVDLEDL